MVPTAVKPAGFLRRAGLSGNVNGCPCPDNNLARMLHKTAAGNITLRIFYDAGIQGHATTARASQCR